MRTSNPTNRIIAGVGGAEVGISYSFYYEKTIVLLPHKKDDIQLAIKHNLSSAQLPDFIIYTFL
jgi:hypothetical protein